MFDPTGPRPQLSPLVVSSMYTQPSEPPEKPAAPLRAWRPVRYIASASRKSSGFSRTNWRRPMDIRSSSPSAMKIRFTGMVPVTS